MLGERLEAVRGCAEWVIALHLLRQPDAGYLAESSAAIKALRGEIESSSPGRAHLLRRRLTELHRDESRRVQHDAAADVLASLGTVSAAANLEAMADDIPILSASMADEMSLLELADRLLNRGVVLTGEATISVAGVD